jgi:hypothetical protein
MESTPSPNGRRERIQCWPFLLLGVFLPVVSFPLVLALLMWRLRLHVDRRLQSPVFRSERFQSPLGQEIIRRLRRCRGRFRHPVAVVLLFHYVFCTSLVAFQLFAVPHMVRGFDSREVFRSIVEVEPATSYDSCRSRAQYEHLGRRWPLVVTYSGVRALTGEEAQARSLPLVGGIVYQRRGRPMPAMEVDARDTSPPPYEGRCRGSDGNLYLVRVSSVRRYWRGTEALGLILYAVFLPLPVVSGMVFCCTFWVRFARHRVAELLAASYALDNHRMCDTLLPLLKWSNVGLLEGVFVLVPFQWFLLPLHGSTVLDGHLFWEKAHQIYDTLEGVRGR